MNRKIPKDAFTFYYSLGPGRSYQALADEYGVTKQAVHKLAAKEKWQERIEVIEAKARQRADQQISETLEEMNLRHLKEVKLLRARAIEYLSKMGLGKPSEAIKALVSSWSQERLIRGEPTERSAMSVEQIVRHEHERWLTDREEDADDADAPEQE